MDPKTELERKLRLDLAASYGEIIGGDTLRKVLGYATGAAMAHAIRTGKLSLPTFFVAGRKGRFALTVDIAHWLSSFRSSTTSDTADLMPVE